MTPSYYLKTNKMRADGLAPIAIFLRHKNAKAEISTDVFISPDQWDGSRITSTDRVAQRKALLLQRWWLDIEDAIIEHRGSDLATVKAAIMAKLFPDRVERPGKTLLSMFDAFISTKAGRTREVYEATRAKVAAFGDVDLDALSVAWISSFEASLRALKVNSRSIHLRNILAVVNFALDIGATQNYPFRKFKIRTESTRKRALTVDQLRDLLTREVEPWQAEYRNFFALTFMLIGINAVDLLNIKAPVGGRIEYRRSKTKRLYSVKLEPEAEAIAALMRGQDWWLSPLDRYTNHKDYLHRANNAMQSVGEVRRDGRGGRKTVVPAFPGISSYWMRHTWATIAAQLEIPKETIAAALGHGGNSVTDIYIDFDRRKIDEANRKVIDFVLYGR